jgi:uncharacterized protein involved in cysteine biosynthesis
MLNFQQFRRPVGTVAHRFWMGFASPWHGLMFMVQHPTLWRYGVIPFLLNLAITAFVLALLVLSTIGFGVYVHPRFSPGWLGRTFEVLSALALLAAAFAASVAVWALLEGTLCGHFYGLLAREVEIELGMPPSEIREISLAYQFVDAARDFAALLGINSAMLLLNCVPVIGSIAALCGALCFDCYIFGRDYLDYPLALRGMRRADKLDFVRRHRASAVGLGASVLLCNLVPIFGAVVLTTAASGAVLLHRQLSESPPGPSLTPEADSPGHI